VPQWPEFPRIECRRQSESKAWMRSQERHWPASVSSGCWRWWRLTRIWHRHRGPPLRAKSGAEEGTSSGIGWTRWVARTGYVQRNDYTVTTVTARIQAQPAKCLALRWLRSYQSTRLTSSYFKAFRLPLPQVTRERALKVRCRQARSAPGTAARAQSNRLLTHRRSSARRFRPELTIAREIIEIPWGAGGDDADCADPASVGWQATQLNLR